MKDNNKDARQVTEHQVGAGTAAKTGLFAALGVIGGSTIASILVGIILVLAICFICSFLYSLGSVS